MNESQLSTRPLMVPGQTPPTTPLGRWMHEGQRLDQPHEVGHGQPWYKVLWLTGVDYFSTLGYQPGIALVAAAALSPLATVFLVVLTLAGAVPIYAMVARRSFAGQGSIAMLEDLLKGWWGKTLVLVLLGFACTDYIITITLSAADAAEHAIHNPYLESHLHGAQVLVTLLLIALLAFVFVRGFHEAIGVAMAVGIPYILLNVVVLGRAFLEIATHPEHLERWREALGRGGSPAAVILAAALVFPKLALGMSGFETGVSVMPQIEGGPKDRGAPYPSGRVRATRRLLLVAALMMSSLLIGSSLVTAILIPEADYQSGGKASGRAIAFLAHQLLGSGFGTLYDASTILILWFAGASAMAGMLNLIPRYLPRFGMAPQILLYRRPLVLVIFGVCVLVTWIFRADVEAQGGAYATGVLVLMQSAAVAVALELTREVKSRRSASARLKGLAVAGYFWGVAAVFTYTLVENVIQRSDGVVIASAFILAIIVVGAASRAWRSMELRVSDLRFASENDAALWAQMTGRKVNVAPLRTSSAEARQRKAEEIRRFYKVKGALAFIHVNLVDNRSEFVAHPTVSVQQEGTDYVVEVMGAVATPNTIAYVTELLEPAGVFLWLTRQNLMVQSIKYLVWGEGEIGLMVYMILLRYWRWVKKKTRGGDEAEGEDVHPNIFLMSA